MAIKNRVEKLMRWLNVLLILCSFLAYLSPFVHPGKFWLLFFFGLAFPWLLLCNFLFVVFWLIKRKRYFLFSLGCILLGWNHVNSFIGFRLMNQPEQANSIRVMSYNMHDLSSLRIKDPVARDKKENAFLRFVNQDGPLDIICAQECSKTNESFISTSLQFNHRHRSGHVGPMIFSKHPILDKGIVKFENSSNSAAWADIQLTSQTIRVYSIHLQSTRVSSLSEKVLTEGDIQEKETWLDIKSMLGRVKRATQQRVAQAQALAEHLAKSPHPVLLCGDFNDNPQSYSYHILTRQLHDAFRQMGKGLGTTYGGKIPALRIDYILADPHFQINDYHTFKENYSDHYPVVGEFGLIGDKQKLK